MRRTAMIALVMGVTLVAPAAASAASADVSVSVSGPARTASGIDATYSITVHNGGPDAAANPALSVPLPPNTTFKAPFGSASGWTGTSPPDGGTGTVNVSTPSLAAGGSATFTLTVHVNGGQANGALIVAQASVSAATPDPALGNNGDSFASMVSNAADLSVTIADSPDPAVTGQNVTYKITVHNAGGLDASSLVFTDSIPTGTTFFAFDAPFWMTTTPPSGGTGAVNATFGTFPAGGTETFTLIVKKTAAGSISDTATISSATADLDPANNSATELTGEPAPPAPPAAITAPAAVPPATSARKCKRKKHRHHAAAAKKKRCKKKR